MFDQATLNRLYRYCHSLCEQESDAFDLLQNAVERCLRSPPDDSDAIYHYTMRTIRNVFIDEYRRNQKIAFEPFDEATQAIDYDIASLEQLALDRVELDFVWPTLSIVEREILFLWAVEGYSTDEVADHLDKPRNTILSIIHRMRKRLKKPVNAAQGVG